MNWYIGQAIVSIINHRQGFFKEGDTHTISALQNCKCKCGGVEISIGIIHNKKHRMVCSECGYEGPAVNTRELFFHESAFRPLDEIADISELTEHLKQTKPFTVNPTNK